MALLHEFLVTDRHTHTHTHGTDHSTPAQARGKYVGSRAVYGGVC